MANEQIDVPAASGTTSEKQGGGQIDSAVATHFVLTRFNVRMPIYQHPGDEWLPGRLELFQKYCLPTFRAQTERQFTWLVFLDSGTPQWLKDIVETTMSDIVHPVYVDGLFTAEYAADVVGRLTKTPYVITTRVDNDDAISSDFVETIQREFTGQRLEFVNLVNGAQYFDEKVYLRPYTRNPFVTLVESAQDGLPLTVFAKRHYEIDKVGPVRNVRTNHPMWLQVVHGENVLTERVGLRARPSAVLPYFSCNLPVNSSRAGYVVDVSRDGLRIAWRLVRQPHRLIELAKSATAPRSGQGGPTASVSAA
jgi:hypothetical protein